MLSSSSSSSVSSISSSPSPPSASASGGSLKPSLLVILLILSITLLLSLSLCLLLRLLNRRCLRHLSTTTSATTLTTTPTPSASNRLSCSSHRVSPEISVIDSLPLFTFGSIKRPNHSSSSSSSSSSSLSADCAVCLSKFEADDQLRLLPLCCHAFHAHCIDTWLRSNQTCPLCRSPLLHHSSESDLIKALSTPPPASAAAANVIINDHHHPPAAAGGSFRLEIGSLSHRRQAVPDSAAPASQERPRRSSYSVGSFEYIVEEGWSEISASATNIHSHSNRRSLCSSSDDKDIINIDGGGGGGGGGGQLARNINDPTGIAVASDRDSEREAGGGRSWLKDYMDRLSSSYSFSISSRALSFRSSGRFFTGSSRRTITPPTGNGTGDYDDVEAAAAAADGVGEEISEVFRWFSGV